MYLLCVNHVLSKQSCTFWCCPSEFENLIFSCINRSNGILQSSNQMMLGGARSTIHDHHPNPHDHAINPSSSLRSASDLNQTQGQQLPCEQLQLEVLWLSTFPHNLHSQAHYLVLSLRVSCYSWSVFTV
jgi:hypothetical protein